MVTHFRVGTNRPTERLNLYVSSVSPLPKSYRDAFNDPNWQSAMCDEYTVKKYATEIFKKAHMVSCNPSRTPVDYESKLGVDGDLVSDPSLYPSLADLVAYSNADCTRCPTTQRSTSGYCVFLGNNLLSWSAKRQPAFYQRFLGPVPKQSIVVLPIDVYLSSNPVQHQRTKHIEIDIHFFRDLVAAGQVRVLQVPSRYHFADIFTKGLALALFEEFRSSLSVRSPPALTTGEC
uniref:Ribonuclease H-like domain-containing protein n=1 Tax=Tanacetum cinerariifolium TaxID=118510 RepID=A0A699K288_TANCI|nr:ribonuclease H-like domain-containing protein [Tanacetum cinerariifolium]